MPYAARYKWKDCWLWEQGSDNGWEEEINGTAIAEIERSNAGEIR